MRLTASILKDAGMAHTPRWLGLTFEEYESEFEVLLGKQSYLNHM